MASEFPISDVVTVAITRETLFPTQEGFSVALLVGDTDVIDHGERVRFYTSPAAVAGDFASTDEESIAAGVAFSQNPRPAQIGIGRVVAADQAGYIRGGTPGTLAAFIAVTDGTFTIDIDGVEEDITGLNFSGDTTYANFAATLQTKIRAIASGGYTLATVEVTSSGAFKITSGTIGASSIVLPLTTEGTGTDISGTLFINARLDVAVVIEGHAFTDFTGELNAIEARNDDWYGLALTRDLQSNANYIAASVWCEARTKLLAAFDNSLGGKDSLSSSDLAALNATAAYDRTFTHWNNDATTYAEVSELVRQVVVDYNVPNSAITLKFKKLPGVSPITATPNERATLLGKNAEIYVTRGGINAVEEGKVASGEFIDVIHSVDFMEQEIALSVFGELLTSATKVPMTDTGIAQIEGAVKVVLDIAVAAGIIASDVDDEGNIVAAYSIETASVLSTSAAQRASRVAPAVTFTARLAGAVHFASVVGTVTV